MLRSLTQISSRHYRKPPKNIFDLDTYFKEVKKALKQTTPQVHNVSFQPRLPSGNIDPNFVKETLLKAEPEGIVVQVDPSPIMHVQRKVAYAKKKESMERKMGLPYPVIISEAMLNFKRMDMYQYLKMGKTFDVKDSFMKDQSITTSQGLENKELLVKASKFVDEYVTLKDVNSVHSRINPSIRTAFTHSLAANLPVYMVQMPEVLHRMQVAVNFTVAQLRGMLENVLDSYKTMEPKADLHQIFAKNYPDIGYLQHNVYMSAMLRHLVYLHSKSILAIMELPYVPLVVGELTKMPKKALIEYKTLLGVPQKNSEEANEDLVEKHAILDVIYSTKLWRERYIENMFMYLDMNKKNITEEDWKFYKRKFMQFYQKYEAVKKATITTQ